MARQDGLDGELAWNSIGLHFGDDAVSRESKNYESVAASLGIRVKVVRHEPGTRGVTFLGRIFPDPWSSTSSMQQPSRVWYKITNSSTGGGIPELRGKWEAYLRSDPHVPV